MYIKGILNSVVGVILDFAVVKAECSPIQSNSLYKNRFSLRTSRSSLKPVKPVSNRQSELTRFVLIMIRQIMHGTVIDF